MRLSEAKRIVSEYLDYVDKENSGGVNTPTAIERSRHITRLGYDVAEGVVSGAEYDRKYALINEIYIPPVDYITQNGKKFERAVRELLDWVPNTGSD